MEISVRFFALYRERAGCSVTRISMPEESTVSDLVEAVRERFPRLAPPDVQIVVAVNEEYAESQTALKANDEICLIPPVSGGLICSGDLLPVFTA